MSYASNAWFAGFIDGEGCFTRDVTGRLKTKRPVFTLVQKAGNEQILYRLQAEFGGYVNVSHRVTPVDDGIRNKYGVRPYTPGGIPSTYKLHLNKRSELEGLVSYLQRFPLQTSKADRFAAWCAEWGFGEQGLVQVPAEAAA